MRLFPAIWNRDFKWRSHPRIRSLRLKLILVGHSAGCRDVLIFLFQHIATTSADRSYGRLWTVSGPVHSKAEYAGSSRSTRSRTRTASNLSKLLSRSAALDIALCDRSVLAGLLRPPLAAALRQAQPHPVLRRMDSPNVDPVDHRIERRRKDLRSSTAHELGRWTEVGYPTAGDGSHDGRSATALAVQR